MNFVIFEFKSININYINYKKGLICKYGSEKMAALNMAFEIFVQNKILKIF